MFSSFSIYQCCWSNALVGTTQATFLTIVLYSLRHASEWVLLPRALHPRGMSQSQTYDHENLDSVLTCVELSRGNGKTNDKKPKKSVLQKAIHCQRVENTYEVDRLEGEGAGNEAEVSSTESIDQWTMLWMSCITSYKTFYWGNIEVWNYTMTMIFLKWPQVKQNGRQVNWCFIPQA